MRWSVSRTKASCSASDCNPIDTIPFGGTWPNRNWEMRYLNQERIIGFHIPRKIWDGKGCAASPAWVTGSKNMCPPGRSTRASCSPMVEIQPNEKAFFEYPDTLAIHWPYRPYRPYLHSMVPPFLVWQPSSAHRTAAPVSAVLRTFEINKGWSLSISPSEKLI